MSKTLVGVLVLLGVLLCSGVVLGRAGVYTPWEPWTPCSQRCGGGVRSRYRDCIDWSNCDCIDLWQSGSCNTQSCGVGGGRGGPCRPGATVFDRCGQRCVCSSGGTLTQCTRIRKEFTSMTTVERERYIQTVKTASTHSSFKRRYDDLLTKHKVFFERGIHRIPNFLPWHRWFVLQYENLLRGVDCKFTVAYWDWSVVAGRPWGTSSRDLWYSGVSGFGGNGQAPNGCVRTGPFREQIWQLVPSVQPPRCLRRAFNGNPPGAVEVALLLRTLPSRVNDFQELLQTYHDQVHCSIQGTMCTQDSAAAPEFFLHHGMVDKIWEDWQKISDAHRTVLFPGIKTPMPAAGGLLPGALINNLDLPGGVRAEWAPTANLQLRRIQNGLRSMSVPQLQNIPRVAPSPLSQRAIQLFNISKSQVEELKRLRALIRPRVRTRKLRESAIDKQLGFNHKIVDSG